MVLFEVSVSNVFKGRIVTSEDGTDKLSRHVGKKSPLLAA